MKPEDHDEQECGKPCAPGDACEECVEYWVRMRRYGFWDDSTGWTDAGMREIIRHA